MKRILGLLVLISLASCNDKTTQASTSVDTIKKDPDSINSMTSSSYVGVDISPMDMSYLPADYPILKMTGKTTKMPVARVIYSRSILAGR